MAGDEACTGREALEDGRTGPRASPGSPVGGRVTAGSASYAGRAPALDGAATWIAASPQCGLGGRWRADRRRTCRRAGRRGPGERPLTLGTAGHIDHGKTTLVKALTGRDTDRLKEEKERGISIELGFAELTLPSGRHVSVVDVPGHERFVKTMVAGATGIDLFLLVVAADDGVMPQTREHLRIIELLGIPTGVVALTKIDMVDPDLVELVDADIEEFLATTRYARRAGRTGEWRDRGGAAGIAGRA